MNPNPFEAPQREQSVSNATERHRTMKSPNKPVIETLCAWGGFAGVGAELAVLFNRQLLPDGVFEFFRGGNAGGVLVGISLLAGFSALPIFIVNVISGTRSWWLLRLGFILCVWAMIIILVSMI